MMGRQGAGCGRKGMPGERPGRRAGLTPGGAGLARLLLLGLALGLGLAPALGPGCPAAEAAATDWSEVNGDNVNKWTGKTGKSQGEDVVNFFYNKSPNTNTDGASNNTLTVRNAGMLGPITGHIYGGYSSNSPAVSEEEDRQGDPINTGATSIANNTVILRTPTPGGTSGIFGSVNVYGGYKYNSSTSSTNKADTIRNNTVIIENGVDLGGGIVVGARQERNGGTLQWIDYNSVFIYGGTMNAVAGAVVDIDNAVQELVADSNKVVVDLRNGGSLTITSGYSLGEGNIYGANTRKGNLSNNSVIIYADNSSGLTLPSDMVIFGGRSGFFKGDATNNTVLIDLSARTTPLTSSFGDVYGGSSGSNSKPATPITFGENGAYDNRVIARGSAAARLEVRNVTGGRAFSGIASRNTVTLTDVLVTGYVSGGHATFDGGGASGNRPKQGIADSNSVSIVRGSVGGTIYGGRVDPEKGDSASYNSVSITDAVVGSVYGGFINPQSVAAVTTNNAVFISGYGMRFTDGAELVGGSHDMTGNSLTTTRAVNMRLSTIKNFEQYTYNMTGNEMDKTVYGITGAAVDFTGTDHTLNFDATVGPALHEGQVMVLIDKTTNNTLSEDKFVKNVRDGFLYNYDSYFGMRGDELIFEITGRKEDDRNVTFGQSQLAGMQMANAASDLARGIHRLYTIRCAPECSDGAGYAPCPDECERGPVAFMTTQGGSYNWDTGGDSRLDLDYVATLAGLGWKNGGLLLAGFFETGMGSYDAKVGGRKIVDGEDVSYVGGGGLVRYERGRAYGEAGFHAGQLDTDFASSTFGAKAAPLDVDYSTKAFYFGLDALAGYKFEVDCSTIDVSARYSWNRVEGDDFTANDARFSQSAANSHRIRAGAEWSYAKNAFHPYVGALYEYEADGETGHEVYGEKIKSASVDGSTGIGRLGLRFGGGEERLSLDIGLEGHVGQRRGLGGTAMLGYAF